MNFLKKYYASLTALAVFVIYLFTLCPSIAPIDSGELATVQLLPGIAHPTGYPLFTVTGYIFSLLPLFSSKIFQMNFLAAIWSALAIYFFIKSSELLFLIPPDKTQKKEETKKKKKGKKKNQTPELQHAKVTESSDIIKIISILTGTLSLAFSKTFWQQSNSVEVYSLQTFLFALIIFFILKALLTTDNKASLKSWLLVALALALGFSNHMTTLLLLPGLAYVYFDKEKFTQEAFVKILKMLVLFFVVLAAFYLYLPLRASAKPLLNWGNPVDWEKFWRHFTGSQYRVWLFSSTAAAKKQFAYYVSNFPSEFGYICWLLALVGIVELYKRSKKLFVFLILNFIVTVAYAINYDIHDIDSYFLLSYFSVSFFVLFGALGILKGDRKKIYFAATVIGIAILIEAVVNFPRADKSDYYVLSDYTNEILNSTAPNSVILTYQWDYFVSPSYYLQLIENRRKDVTVIDKELLRRSWYYDQLARRDANVLKGIQTLVKGFKKALQPFERGERFNSALLEKYYRSIMTGLVATNFPERSFYILPELADNEMRRGEFGLPKGLSLVPEWFGYKVVKGENYVPAKVPDLKIRFPKHPEHYSKFVLNLISEMLAKRALYELAYNQKEKAIGFTKYLLKFNPDYLLPDDLLKILNSKE